MGREGPGLAAELRKLLGELNESPSLRRAVESLLSPSERALLHLLREILGGRIESDAGGVHRAGREAP